MFCLYITHGEAPESCSVALALLASNSALPTSPSTHHRPRIESVSYFSYFSYFSFYSPTKNRVRLLLLLPPTPSLTKIRVRLFEDSPSFCTMNQLKSPQNSKKRKEMALLALSLEDIFLLENLEFLL